MNGSSLAGSTARMFGSGIVHFVVAPGAAPSCFQGAGFDFLVRRFFRRLGLQPQRKLNVLNWALAPEGSISPEEIFAKPRLAMHTIHLNSQ
jgi:hypothetical protein